MKQKLTPRRLIIKLTGISFALYSAYNVIVYNRDGGAMTTEGRFITLVVALMFGVLAFYAWSFEIKDVRFRVVRRVSLLIALLVIFLLKLRLVSRYAAFFDFTKPYIILYCGAYFMTLAAMLILLVYYAFIRKRIPLFPKASAALPILAAALFLYSFVFEALLFIVYNIGMEASELRTVVIRPIFYLGFIGLSMYFLFPPQTKIRRN